MRHRVQHHDVGFEHSRGERRSGQRESGYRAGRSTNDEAQKCLLQRDGQVRPDISGRHPRPDPKRDRALDVRPKTGR